MRKIESYTCFAISLFMWLIVSSNSSMASTLTVTTNADGDVPGELSLRAALASSKSGDTIDFDVKKLNGSTIYLDPTLRTLTVDKDLLVTAAKLPAGVAVSGNRAGGGTFPVFTVRAAKIRMDKLTITGSGGVSGAGIVSNQNSDLTLIGCTITDNLGDSGAGINNRAGRVRLVDCSVANNSARSNTGGLYNDGGSVELENCVIADNFQRTYGGAISSRNGNLDMDRCLVTRNNGGSGGILIERGQATISDTEILNNTTSGIGGGLANRGGTTTLTRCDFRANRGSSTWSNDNVAPDTGSLRAFNCRISSNSTNRVVTNSNGNLEMDDCVVSDNVAFIILVSGVNTQNRILNSRFVNNRPVSYGVSYCIDNIPGAFMELRGCTIADNSLAGITNSGNMEIHNSTISRNVAGNPGEGGGVNNRGTLIVTESTVSENRDDSQAGGIFTSTYGNRASILRMQKCTISANRTVNGKAGGIVAEVLPGNGMTVELENCTVSGNSGREAGGIYFDAGPVSSDMILTSCTITENSATGNEERQTGGGIHIRALPTSHFISRNNIIAGNYSRPGQAQDVKGSVDSQGFNLIRTVEGSSGWIPTDLVGSESEPVEPKLGPLTDNGGATNTHALKTASPAVDAGDPKLAGTTDQRRVLRQIPDIGAYEIGKLPLPSVSKKNK